MSFAGRLVRSTLGPLALLLVFMPARVVFTPSPGQAGPALRAEAKPPRPRRGGAAPGAPAHVLQSVYVAGVLALPVVQQPGGVATYVSRAEDQATQFSLAARYGSIGLLAHNYLSGASFFRLTVGQRVRLIYRDGVIEDFVVAQILRFQALRPEDPSSRLRDLADDKVLSATQVFRRVYAGTRHVTFQTCIARDGNLSWGRLFVIATPVAAMAYESRPRLPV